MAASQDLSPYASVLAVRDLDGSSRYFQDALGFRLEWADRTNWHCLARGSVRVMLGHCPEVIPPADLGDHSYFAYLHSADLDGLYAEYLASGAVIKSAPEDKSWGMREMAIATPEGHRFMVGQVLSRNEPL